MNQESNVREQTCEKVLSAVQALRYRPNAAARALCGNRSRVVELVCGNAQAFGYTQDVLHGAPGACEAQDYTLLLCPIGLPAALSLVGAAVLYRLDRAQVERIEAELA